MKEKLKDFIAYAKKKGYASSFSIPRKTQDGGKTYKIKKGGYVYVDTYFGNLIDCGQERIYYKGKVIWLMAYRGGSLNKDLSGEAFNFLKKCISKIPKDFPARTNGKEIYGVLLERKIFFIREIKFVSETIWGV
jgi:hypothetical protein